jgi:hypothetical protein
VAVVIKLSVPRTAAAGLVLFDIQHLADRTNLELAWMTSLNKKSWGGWG